MFKLFHTYLITGARIQQQIDPPYSQCLQLCSWVAENREMLNSFTVRSTSQSGYLISVLVDEELMSMANGHFFTIEAKITLPNTLKCCYVLACLCGQEVRSPSKRKFQCMNCKQQTMLSPRCRFDVNLEDDSGSIIVTVMGKEGEKLSSLSAEEIYNLASTENESQSIRSV